MNDLHCISMICLAGAAIGFSNAGTSGDFDNWLWLSRVSFLLPLLLAAMQVLRPDSCEALATRLFQDIRESAAFGFLRACAEIMEGDNANRDLFGQRDEFKDVSCVDQVLQVARAVQEARQKLPELKEEKEVELFVDLVSF
ncbi:unnamed protein product [Effrenium voratum]|nr:unnamed protein product [Effrenium voratum]